MNKLRRNVAVLLAILALFLLISPSAPAHAANSAERWELAMIRAEFSAQIGIQGHGVRVAVIDSGITPLPSLPGLQPGKDYTGEGSTEDDLGHGTFIAGIIAGSDPEAGFQGVAPGAEIVPLRCFTSQGTELSRVVSAIYDAVDEFECGVISLSFGQKRDDPALRKAVEYALSRGVVLVAAAGNSAGSELYYPAAYEGVIAVSAVDENEGIARDAQHNSSVALSAPGVKVSGPTPTGDYALRSGSSFAVPFVTGAAALLLSVDGDLTPEEIGKLLYSTAADRGEPGRDQSYGWGILDLEAALKKALSAWPCWLSEPEALPGGIELTAYNFGAEAVEGVCRLGDQALPLSLAPGESEVLRFSPQPTESLCALWRAEGSGGESCISNLRRWSGAAPVFSDVPEDSWFHDAVAAVSLAGIMTGLPDGRFDPSGTVTRAMFVTVLYRTAGSPDAPEQSPFADVEPGDWYAPAVCWAAEAGLVMGVSEVSFAPALPLTREEMAVILLRLCAGEGRSDSGKQLSDYGDSEDISPWALQGMDYCVSLGLLLGVSDSELAPRGTLTRAALAVLLTRLIE